MTEAYTPKAAQYKKDVVATLAKKLDESPIIGALDLQDLPAPAAQTMRGKLRGKAEIFMTKKRFMKLAFDQTKRPGLGKLFDRLKGMPALLFTEENPFAIYKLIKQNKSPAPAKAGQEAPKDIEVKAGPTPFMPGPIIGELGSLGLKTGVENGKVAIKEDKIVAKAGDAISEQMAGLLTRLGIQPMEVGLDLIAVYEDGTIYGRDVLDIDEDRFLGDVEQAAAWARNLAVEAAWPAHGIIDMLIGKAASGARALGVEASVVNAELIGDMIIKAQRQGAALKHAAKMEE